DSQTGEQADDERDRRRPVEKNGADVAARRLVSRVTVRGLRGSLARNRPVGSPTKIATDNIDHPVSPRLIHLAGLPPMWPTCCLRVILLWIAFVSCHRVKRHSKSKLCLNHARLAWPVKGTARDGRKAENPSRRIALMALAARRIAC